CPSKKEKLEQTLENISETEKDLDFSELETPSQIKDLKTKLGEEIKKVKELQKKKTDKLTEEESKALANLPVLQEVQTLVQDVEKKADFDKKVYGTWDYAYAGGIVVGVFLEKRSKVMALLALLAKPAIVGLINTPANRAEQAGVPKTQLYEDAKKRREDKKKYYEEKNKEVLNEISELKKQLDKLEKQKTKQAQEVADESDPTEKAKKIAAMKDTEKEIVEVQKQIKDKERQIEKNNKELEKAFDDIGNLSNLTEEQFTAKSNSPDLGIATTYATKKVVDKVVDSSIPKNSNNPPTNTQAQQQEILKPITDRLDNLDKDISEKIKEQLGDKQLTPREKKEKLEEIKKMSKEEKAELLQQLKNENSAEQEVINKALKDKLDKQEKRNIQLAEELRKAKESNDPAQIAKITAMMKDNDKNQQATRLALKKNEEEAKKQAKLLEQYFQSTEQDKP
ncbi:43640_t:CDS:2, partial [Gigaspora margarita]